MRLGQVQEVDACVAQQMPNYTDSLENVASLIQHCEDFLARLHHKIVLTVASASTRAV